MPIYTNRMRYKEYYISKIPRTLNGDIYYDQQLYRKKEEVDGKKDRILIFLILGHD